MQPLMDRGHFILDDPPLSFLHDFAFLDILGTVCLSSAVSQAVELLPIADASTFNCPRHSNRVGVEALRSALHYMHTCRQDDSTGPTGFRTSSEVASEVPIQRTCFLSGSPTLARAGIHFPSGTVPDGP